MPMSAAKPAVAKAASTIESRNGRRRQVESEHAEVEMRARG